MRWSIIKSAAIGSAVLITVYYQCFSDSRNYIDTGQPSEILGAMNFMTQQRAYPGKVIKGGKFYSEYQQSSSRIKKVVSDDSWELLGPFNQGGRTNLIVVDPNNTEIIYAGSASGGLWKMKYYSDENYTWERVNTGYPVLGVNAIAIDQRDSNIIYIGTGEVYGYQNSNGGLHIRTTRGSYGIGLLKTVDGGVNWTKSIDWTYSMQRGILAIDIDPDNPDIIYSGTTEGLYKSINSGESWMLVNSTVMAVDIEINPNNTDILFVSFGNFETEGNGIYRSDNAGDTWTKLSGGLPDSWTGKTMIDIYENEPNIIYADVANMFSSLGLYKSEDNGKTWTLLSNEGYSGGQGWFSHYVRVDPEDNKKIFLAGVPHGSSEDGGTTFYQRPSENMHLDNHAFANHPSDPDIIYFATDGGVYRTQDGGWTISPLNRGYVTAQFYPGFSCSATDSNFAAGGLQDNSVMTFRGSPDWVREGFADGNYAFIDPNDDNVIYASNQRLQIFKSRIKV